MLNDKNVKTMNCTGKDACVYNNGGCSPNATCTELHPGRQCTCNEGYTGDGYTCTGEYHMHCICVLIRSPRSIVKNCFRTGSRKAIISAHGHKHRKKVQRKIKVSAIARISHSRIWRKKHCCFLDVGVLRQK